MFVFNVAIKTVMMLCQYCLEVLQLNSIYWPVINELNASIVNELCNYRMCNVTCSTLYINPLVPSDTCGALQDAGFDSQMMQYKHRQVMAVLM